MPSPTRTFLFRELIGSSHPAPAEIKNAETSNPAGAFFKMEQKQMTKEQEQQIKDLMEQNKKLAEEAVRIAKEIKEGQTDEY